VVVALCLFAACGGRSGSSRKPAPDETRQAIVAFGEEKYRRLEEPEEPNDCTADADCHIGGCAQYACTASTGLMGVCDRKLQPPVAASCGCVEGACVWWRPTGYRGDGARGMPCVDGRCVKGLECFGDAPDNRCEIYCKEGIGADSILCPGGEACVNFQCQR
jgi:hypothetical protein